MTKYLIFLSTLVTSLSLVGNSINNHPHNSISDKNTLLTNTTEEKNTLFNNQYKYLSNSDWITHQSTTDNKFYSYDTSALTNYKFTDAQNTFLVDPTGNLVYNSDVTVPDKDKTNIENTRQEMITTRKVNTITNDYNPYSKSEYSNSYFNGDNTDWQYIQQGGIEKHIDISEQTGANQVDHSNNLSETLGLYYISKAAHLNKISKAIADNLAIYFINQTSLKGKISNELTTTIVNLIISNNDVYNFIYNTPFYLANKDYSLNWIFDKSNNLIAVYYNNWDHNHTNNINNDKINYSFSDWHNGTSIASDNSNTYDILKWKSANIRDWDTFTNVFPTFSFINSYFEATTSTGIKSSPTLSANTAKIQTYKNPGNANVLFIASINTKDGTGWGTEITLNLDLWHDDNYIYFQWYSFLNSSFGRMTYVNIALNSISFYNIMNS